MRHVRILRDGRPGGGLQEGVGDRDRLRDDATLSPEVGRPGVERPQLEARGEQCRELVPQPGGHRALGIMATTSSMSDSLSERVTQPFGSRIARSSPSTWTRPVEPVLTPPGAVGFGAGLAVGSGVGSVVGAGVGLGLGRRGHAASPTATALGVPGFATAAADRTAATGARRGARGGAAGEQQGEAHGQASGGRTSGHRGSRDGRGRPA